MAFICPMLGHGAVVCTGELSRGVRKLSDGVLGHTWLGPGYGRLLRALLVCPMQHGHLVLVCEDMTQKKPQEKLWEIWWGWG